eukprot:2216306-Rhodomonas_salina.4
MAWKAQESERRCGDVCEVVGKSGIATFPRREKDFLWDVAERVVADVQRNLQSTPLVGQDLC